ncbi:MAG TPA: flagellar basal body-associated FliL family protein [Rubrivivax sp.]|nr:flagellar basal body-associated FliL family protein [Rubrivivax sp.]
MSTATAVAAPPPTKLKKKLILIVAVAALLVLGVGGGAAALLLKKNAGASDAEGEGEDATPPAAVRRHSGATPVFVPLDPFTVNLADRQADRYAQVGITLEIDDAKTGDEIKTFMPAIRNNVLMAIADRTAADLLGRDGTALLAERITREASRALGYEVDDEVLDVPAEDAPVATGKKKHQAAAPALPVKAVHFSNFIIQ